MAVAEGDASRGAMVEETKKKEAVAASSSYHTQVVQVERSKRLLEACVMKLLSSL